MLYSSVTPVRCRRQSKVSSHTCRTAAGRPALSLNRGCSASASLPTDPLVPAPAPDSPPVLSTMNSRSCRDNSCLPFDGWLVLASRASTASPDMTHYSQLWLTDRSRLCHQLSPCWLIRLVR